MEKLKETTDRQQQLLTGLINQLIEMDNKYEHIFQETRKEREETSVLS